jgi:TPR repeat protein
MGEMRRPALDRQCMQLRMKAASRPRRALAIAALGVTAALLAAANPAPGEPSALPLRLAQTRGADTLQIAVASSISAQSASQVALQIRLAPANALPKNSFVRVRGLPPAVSLSGGYATAPGAWAVPLYALASLQMIVPAGVAGRAELSISLVGEDGTLLADAKSVLVVEQSVQAAPKESKADVLPPARPQGPMLSPADRETAERLVARGERELEQGQVAVARQFLLRAAQAGLARGALLLAATYDPRELARWRVQGVQPNLDEARKWYERARELGAPEAEERLARLGAG